MPTTRERELRAYIARLQRLERTRSRMEQLLAAERITRADVEYVYAAAMLSAVNGLELLMENLFVGFLTRKVRPAQGMRILVSAPSTDVARALLLGDQQYAEWLPYQKTSQRAERLMLNGGPFARIADDDLRLRQAQVVRNAIAHDSHFALQKFRDKVTSSLSLLPRERQKPGAYLRNVMRQYPEQRRLQHHVIQLRDVAAEICR